MEHYYTSDPSVKSEERKIEYEIAGNKFVFISDNGVFSKDSVDFGSSLMLKSITEFDKTTILDVGCGYGVIGITLALFNPQATITMVDVNLRALELSKNNALKNGVDNVIIKESFAYQNVEGKFDMIVTNPPIRAGKAVVHEILEGSFDHLNDDGVLYVVIQKKQGAESAVKKLKTLYSVVDKITQDKGYWILKCKK